MITIKPRNYRKFISKLSELVEDIDLGKSRGAKNSVALKDGTIIRGGNTRGLLSALNEHLGKEYFAVKKSRILSGGSYCVRINEEPTEIVETETKVVEPVVEEVIEQTPAEEASVEVDWDFVNSLENNKEDKVKLDEYAATLGVKLNQRNSLANMIKMFKEEL